MIRYPRVLYGEIKRSYNSVSEVLFTESLKETCSKLMLSGRERRNDSQRIIIHGQLERIAH